MTETKPTAPGEAKPKAPETPEPTIHVRAIDECYVAGVYYNIGDEFDVVASGFNDKCMERVGATPKKP